MKSVSPSPYSLVHWSPLKKVNQFSPHFKWWTFGISLKKLQNKTMWQIKDTLPRISAVLEMKWRHKVCVAGGWWGGGADQICLERQCHSCPLQIGLWELGQGSRVERQTQTAAVEDVKSLARVDRELGVVTQRPVSTPPYRPSDRLRRENFPCCIPVLLSGLSGNACTNARDGLQRLLALHASPSRVSTTERLQGFWECHVQRAWKQGGPETAAWSQP